MSPRAFRRILNYGPFCLLVSGTATYDETQSPPVKLLAVEAYSLAASLPQTTYTTMTAYTYAAQNLTQTVGVVACPYYLREGAMRKLVAELSRDMAQDMILGLSEEDYK